MGNLREELAEYAHEAWSEWMKYLFSRCEGIGEWDSVWGGTTYIPKEFCDRWVRQMNTSYADLPENEKESDLAEADKMIEIFKRYSNG